MPAGQSDPYPVAEDAIADHRLDPDLWNISMLPAPVGGVITVSSPTFTGKGRRWGRSKAYVNGLLDASGQNGGEIIIDANGDWSFTTAPRSNGTYNFQPVGGQPVTFTIANPTQPLLDENGLVATFDYNPVSNIFYTNNIPYADEASFLFAAGASSVLSGAAIQIGPYTPPGQSNLISNGTFDLSTVGWTAITTTATNLPTLSVNAGQMQIAPLTGSNLPGAYTVMTDPEGSAGNAYSYTATITKGSGAGPSLTQIASIQGNFGTGITAANSITTLTPTTQTLYLAASATQSANIVGVRNASTTSDNNVFFIDNVSVFYVCPYQGWVRGAYTVFLDFTLPAATPSADQVVFQAGIQSTRDSVIVHRGTDQVLLVDVRSNNVSQTSLSFGAIANSTRCRLALSIGLNIMSGPNMINENAQQHFTATLNGSKPITSAAGAKTTPGPSHIWLKCGYTTTPGSAFPGTLQRASILRGQQSMEYCQYLTCKHLIGGPVSTSPIVMAGDSFAGGAGGVVFGDKLAAASGRPVINIGKGGQTMDQIKAIITARSWVRDMTLVIWDGQNNGAGTPSAYYALMGQIMDFIGHNRIVFLPPVGIGYGNGTVLQGVQDVITVYNLLAADSRCRTFNPQTVLANANAPVTQHDIDDDLSKVVRKDMYVLDGVHLNSFGMDVVVANTISTLAAGTPI